MSVNFVIGDFISQWRVATLSKVKYAELKVNAQCILPIVKILYMHGLIRSFKCTYNHIIIYFKYTDNEVGNYKLTAVSTPGHRIYWSLDQLSKNYNQYNFSGFYILSTKYGLKTSTECLFFSYIGGEVLLKVEI